MTFSVDMSEVRAFAADVGRVAGGKFDAVTAAVKESAELLCEAAADDAAGSRSFSRVGSSWTSEPTAAAFREIAYEAGPDRGKDSAAGLLGAYLGWPNGGGGTLSLDAPVKAVEGPMLRKLGEALGRVL